MIMSNLNMNSNSLWRDFLIRAALIIITVVIAVWSMPHDTTNIFHVERGKPWKYAELTAPFDFPILKSEEVIKHERDSVLKGYEPYYRYQDDIGRRTVKKFATDYADGIPGVSDDYISIISNRLHSLYQQGIMESKEYEELSEDSTTMIRMVSQKQAYSVSIQEIYSAKKAYEQLFMDEKIAPLRQLLQKCNLNEYIVPNLIYDKDRSETSKNELIASIPLASGLVQKGEKIVDRGEIVTDKTYSTIESYLKENDRRNADKTQNRISLLGQVIYVSILMICFTLYLSLYRRDYFEKPRNITMLYALILLFVLLTALFVRNTFVHVYILPYAMVPIFIRVFMDSRTAFMTHVIMILICALMLQHPFEFILRSQTGVTQVSALSLPVLQPTIIKHFQFVRDDEWNNMISQTFFEQQQPSDTTVAVLEWVDSFKAVMKIQQIIKVFFFNAVVFRKQLFHLSADKLRRCCFLTADFVRNLFVFTNCKPIKT